jgi:hypothetical protein
MRVRPTWIELLVVVSIIGALAGLMMPAGDFDREHRYPSPASRHLPGPAGVAGEYYLGNGRGTNHSLSVLSDGRYSFVSSGCTGVHHRESGFVHETEGRYVLSPNEPSASAFKRDFILIGWGQRHYLIPADEMQELRDAIIEGREPRDDMHGRFYVRLPIASAEGLPDSPPERARDLIKGVLLGRVIEVSAAGLAKIGRVKVDLGAKDGVRAGEMVVVQRHGHAQGRRFRVVSVTDHSCVADESFPDASEHPLKPGLAVVAVMTEVEDRPR